jgi:ABC-type transport system substrate-binding protein
MAPDPAERTRIYAELQQLFYDTAIQITLSQETQVRYEQRWVEDYYYNPILFAGYYYAWGLKTE